MNFISTDSVTENESDKDSYSYNSPVRNLPPVEHPGHWLLMLDVDGTVLDIANRPDAITVSAALKETLLKLHELLGGALVLISGRSIRELDLIFAPLRLPAAGLHGGEYRLDGKNIRKLEGPKNEALKALREQCKKIAEAFPKVFLEQKPFSVALHYRLNPDIGKKIEVAAEKVVRSLGREWKLLKGKMVCEILPAAFDKESVVKKLCEMERFAHRKPVFAGDDVTDANALALVHELHGMAIKVGEGVSGGIIHVDNPAQFRLWLSRIAAHNNIPLQRPLQGKRKHTGPQISGRTLIISNRVTFAQSKKDDMGGLAMAMHAVLKSHGGIWIGWSGQISDSETPQQSHSGNISYLVRDLSAQEHELFYLQFCNGALWSLLHYNIGLLDFSREAYDVYQSVNRKYAELLQSVLEPDDNIWVHDFHFIPLAMHLRRMGCKNRIGFFLHTPFPSPEVLMTLPVHRELMECFYAYDLVGLQTQRDLQAFNDYSANEGISIDRANPASVQTDIASFPIGIEASDFAKLSKKAIFKKEAQDLKANLAGRKLILGVDRLDYSKGILQRFKAVEELLNRNEHHLKKFTYLQISPPTREGLAQYAQLRAEVEAMAGHINGKYAEVDWMPIRLLIKGMKRDLLAAFYRMAHIGLVTPLRDGMNLVAKEFVAAQDPQDPGVLILSRFAGAAEELHEALLVNPHDTGEISDAIDRALVMPKAERQERWRAMYRTISEQTLGKWYQDFLYALNGE